MVAKVCGKCGVASGSVYGRGLETEVIFTPLFFSLPEEEVTKVLTESLVIAYEELLKMYKEVKQK